MPLDSVPSAPRSSLAPASDAGILYPHYTSATLITTCSRAVILHLTVTMTAPPLRGLAGFSVPRRSNTTPPSTNDGVAEKTIRHQSNMRSVAGEHWIRLFRQQKHTFVVEFRWWRGCFNVFNYKMMKPNIILPGPSIVFMEDKSI